MYKGIYISASGAVTKQRQLEITSNNMANAATYGFKKDGITFRDFLISEMNGKKQSGDGRDMTYFSEFYTDHSGGPAVETGNSLDVAIDGEGFFAVDGNKYTRAGNFKVSFEGFLVTAKDEQVLGLNGPVQIPAGAEVQIGTKGDIYVDGSVVDKLQVVSFDDNKQLVKVGDSNYTTTQEPVASEARIHQGYLEQSNVNVIKEMVSLIELHRDFEMHQKMINAFDEAAGRISNDMARL